MENLTKISEKDLKNAKINGNYLFNDGDDYYFSNKFSHIVFTKTEVEDEGFGKRIIDFEQYVEDWCNICNKIENKPNIIFYDYYKRNLLQILNDERRNYKIIDNEDIKQKPLETVINLFENETFITNIEKLDNFLTKITEKRQKTSKTMLIFIYEPERTSVLKNMDLDQLLPKCIEKNIFIVFNILDKAKFVDAYGQRKYDVISENSIKFICKNQDVIDIKSDEQTLLLENLLKFNEKTLKKQLKTENKPQIYEKKSFDVYLEEKKTNNEKFTFNMTHRNIMTLFRVKRVIKDIPESLKNWYSIFDGGTINGVEMFATASKGGITLKEANSKKFKDEEKLPNNYYYIGRYKNEYYIGLKKNWKIMSNYNYARDFNIVYNYKTDEKPVDLDFYEVLDYIEDEQDDDQDVK